jgi:hypothetical protein
MEGLHDLSSSTSISPSSSFRHDDLRQQMTGIFQMIDKHDTGYISIAQLEETIRDLVSEGHNPDFMEFIQSFGAYMDTINALGNDSVDVNKMDLDAFCTCTKNYMKWRRVRQVKRQDSSLLYLVCTQSSLFLILLCKVVVVFVVMLFCFVLCQLR